MSVLRSLSSEETRPRSSPQPENPQQIPLAKKQNSPPQRTYWYNGPPPGFWDTLTKIRLTGAALREFDRRTRQEKFQFNLTPVHIGKSSTCRVRQRLKRFARRGGPNLSHVRGFSEPPLSINAMMNSSAGDPTKGQPSTSGKKATKRKKKMDPLDANFEQFMMDKGVYPDEFEYDADIVPPKLANLDDIQSRLGARRPSLSELADAEFDAFRRTNKQVSSQATVLYRLIPSIAGNENGRHRSEAGIPFDNLELLDKNLFIPKPSLYYGSAPYTIHSTVREVLANYIIPSKGLASRPAAPNFFLEGVSELEEASNVQKQALYNAAVGARAMHKLQNYGAEEPVYDNKAYSFSSWYIAPTATLAIYAVRPTPPKTPDGRPEYHLTQLNMFAMTGSKQQFIEGATAYRNARDLAKSYRESFIAQASEKARQAARGATGLAGIAGAGVAGAAGAAGAAGVAGGATGVSGIAGAGADGSSATLTESRTSESAMTQQG